LAIISAEVEVHLDYCADNNIGNSAAHPGAGGCGFCDKDQILYSIIAGGRHYNPAISWMLTGKFLAVW